MTSTTQERRMTRQQAFRHWIKTHDIWVFFVLTFQLTFGGWLLAMLTRVETLFDLGLWGPTLAAVITTAITQGRLGLKEILNRLLLWRVPVKWYARNRSKLWNSQENKFVTII